MIGGFFNAVSAVIVLLLLMLVVIVVLLAKVLPVKLMVKFTKT